MDGMIGSAKHSLLFSSFFSSAMALVIITTKLCFVPALFSEAAKAKAPGAHRASQKCVTIAMSVVIALPLSLDAVERSFQRYPTSSIHD